MEFKLATLEQFPDKKGELVRLIETAFNYNSKQSFAVDFYPLIAPRNYAHCFMLMKDQKVVATCAFKQREIMLRSKHVICFMGGIAVDGRFRGLGLGKKILENVLKLLPEHAWVGLWSEKRDFFSKFQFSPYGDQHFIPQGTLLCTKSEYSFKKIPLHLINETQIISWKSYYQQMSQNTTTLIRTEKDWEEVLQIKSATYLEITKNKSVIGYAVANKGMDLNTVIHEFFVQPLDVAEVLNLLNSEFAIWLPCFSLPMVDIFLGQNLLLRRGDDILWSKWKNEFEKSLEQKKYLMISGLDSV